MTLQPNSQTEMSSPVTSAGIAAVTPARHLTEPMRELCALALLAGNAVFLFLGFSGLFFVIDRWASDFGLRSAAVFPTFVGPLSLGLPLVAVLLATHVGPMVPRSRLVLLTALAEYGVNALLGTVTFLGAFAHDLSSVRATLEGLLGRAVWLAFLVLGCILLVRIWMGLFPAPTPPAVAYGPYVQPTYGKPYPGQPMYPQQSTAFRRGSAQPNYPGSNDPTSDTGWPLVPPPPMPEPLVVEPLVVEADPTMRISPSTAEVGGDATQLVPPPAGPPTPAERVEPPTQQIGR